MRLPIDEQADEGQAEPWHREPRLGSYLDRAEKTYRQTLTYLWIGNGGAAGTTITFMGVTKTPPPWQLTVALCAFLVGLVLLGVGALFYLWSEGRRIDRFALAESPLDTLMDDIKSPSAEIGLALSDPRTCTAILSGGCFIAGCLFGLWWAIHGASVHT
jgi:hypothetical protein